MARGMVLGMAACGGAIPGGSLDRPSFDPIFPTFCLALSRKWPHRIGGRSQSLGRVKDGVDAVTRVAPIDPGQNSCHEFSRRAHRSLDPTVRATVS